MTSTPATPPKRPTRAPLWRLAARQAWRDLRAGEWRLVLMAVVLSVAALTAVGFFANRLQAGLVRDAAALQGGDVVLLGDQPLPEAFVRQAQAAGLRVSLSANFPSMARAPDERGGATRLVSLKAVDAAYPLRGTLTLRPQADASPQSVADHPAAGDVWIDEALLPALGVQVGDALWVGESRLRISRVIVLEPDRGAGFMNFAPRVMMAQADLAATGLVQPASRVRYRLAVAAADGRVEPAQAYARWARAAIEAQDLRGIRVETLEEGRPEMRQTLERAGKFLNLVALLAALLAAVAVALAARDFAERHLDDCAMLRVLGLSQRDIALLHGLEFLWLGLLASGLGVAAGWGVHHLLLGLLAGLLPAELPSASAVPALMGMGMGLTLLLGFGLPPVLQLASVPALRVIRRELGGLKPASWGVLAAGVAGFSALLLLVAQDLTMGAIAVGGFGLAVLAFALLAWLALRALAAGVARTAAPLWLRLAIRQVVARPAFAVLQVASLAVGLMALVLLVLVRTDLVSSWRQATPADAPNRFVINLQPDQVAAFEQMLAQAGVGAHDLYPMIRGRLVSINGQPPSPALLSQERARRLLEREFNLSHAAQLPAHNQVVAGRWVGGEAEGLSIEEGIASTLGLQLGDRLSFDVAGTLRTGRITSVRKLEWSSMRANFFVMFPLAEMPELPATWLAAFKAPADPAFDRQLVTRFPNLTSVDVGASIAQVQGVLDQVIAAVETLFLFTLACGLVVLLAAVRATREARAREIAVMRAIGAANALLGRVQAAELLGVGALAGALASVAAWAVGWTLAQRVFEFAWTASAWVLLAGVAAGAVLAWAGGWWSLREVLRRPVMHTLRQAQP